MKKMDEMDRNIRMRSESWGYRVAMLFLWIWLVYNLYKTIVRGTRIELLPLVIFSLSSAVQSLSEVMMRRKMVVGDEEYKNRRESNLIFEVIIGITMIIFLIIYGGAFLLATAV